MKNIYFAFYYMSEIERFQIPGPYPQDERLLGLDTSLPSLSYPICCRRTAVQIAGINPLISTASPRYPIQEDLYKSRDEQADSRIILTEASPDFSVFLSLYKQYIYRKDEDSLIKGRYNVHERGTDMKVYPMESFSKSALRELSGDPGFWKDPSLPFGQIRLQQYLANPYADEDDILWLFSRSEEGIIAYLGMVQDYVWLKGRRQKINWITSQWVHPSLRGTGLGDEQLRKARACNEHFAGNSGTPISQGRALKYHGMRKYTERARSFYLCNLNASILQDFGLLNPVVKAVLPLGQAILGAVYKLKLRSWLRSRQPCQIKIEQLSQLDSESLAFLAGFWPQDFAIHSPESFEWRSNNLVNTPRLKGIEAVRKTYFGNLGFSQQVFNLKLLNEGEMIGYLNLVITDKILKLPYFYLNSDYAEQFMTFLGKVVLHNEIQAIYSQHPGFNSLMQEQRFPRLYTKSYQMPVLISAALEGLEPGKIVQDGDGAF